MGFLLSPKGGRACTHCARRRRSSRGARHPAPDCPAPELACAPAGHEAERTVCGAGFLLGRPGVPSALVLLEARVHGPATIAVHAYGGDVDVARVVVRAARAIVVGYWGDTPTSRALGPL